MPIYGQEQEGLEEQQVPAQTEITSGLIRQERREKRKIERQKKRVARKEAKELEKQERKEARQKAIQEMLIEGGARPDPETGMVSEKEEKRFRRNRARQIFGSIMSGIGRGMQSQATAIQGLAGVSPDFQMTQRATADISRNERLRELDDPYSNMSRKYQELAHSVMPTDSEGNPIDWTQTSALEFQKLYPDILRSLGTGGAMTEYQRQRMAYRKKLEQWRIDRMVKDYQKTMEGPRKVEEGFMRAEDALGIPLDKITDENLDQVPPVLFGKQIPKDLKAKKFRQAVYDIMQTKIYDASGKQINAEEMKRFRKMFGKDYFGDKNALISALKWYKLTMKRKLARIDAAYSNVVRRTYWSRYKEPSKKGLTRYSVKEKKKKGETKSVKKKAPENIKETSTEELEKYLEDE